MNIKKENLFLEHTFLSEVELYFSLPENVSNDSVIITDDEALHISKVMRHKIGEEIYTTNGIGNIFKTHITSIDKREIRCEIIETFSYKKDFPNYIFCIPKLRKPDRFEFALEKCIELGITEFIIYEAERSISKGEKMVRWNKIALGAVKQSLRSFIPNIKFCKNLKEIYQLPGEKIIFEQKGIPFKKGLPSNEHQENVYFIFGPEGGITANEFELFSENTRLKLTENRLRTETAVITAASLLTSLK